MSLKFLWCLFAAIMLGSGILFVETATSSLAWAQSSTEVNVTPITESLLAILAAVLTGVATWIGVLAKAWIATKIDLSKTDLDEKLQQRYNQAALRGIAYAESVIKGKIPDTVDTRNEFVKVAADYVIQYWPELVERFGLTPENVRDTIISRLPSPTSDKADAAAAVAVGGMVTVEPSPAKK